MLRETRHERPRRPDHPERHQGKTVFDEEKKELIYTLGCVLEKMSKPVEAIEQFKLIYESDIGYKDVAAKVDAYYSGQQ